MYLFKQENVPRTSGKKRGGANGKLCVGGGGTVGGGGGNDRGTGRDIYNEGRRKGAAGT